MFFVTVLLNEVVAWMRAQPGTQSLRALLGVVLSTQNPVDLDYKGLSNVGGEIAFFDPTGTIQPELGSAKTAQQRNDTALRAGGDTASQGRWQKRGRGDKKGHRNSELP